MIYLLTYLFWYIIKETLAKQEHEKDFITLLAFKIN